MFVFLLGSCDVKYYHRDDDHTGDTRVSSCFTFEKCAWQCGSFKKSRTRVKFHQFSCLLALQTECVLCTGANAKTVGLQACKPATGMSAGSRLTEPSRTISSPLTDLQG